MKEKGPASRSVVVPIEEPLSAVDYSVQQKLLSVAHLERVLPRLLLNRE